VRGAPSEVLGRFLSRSHFGVGAAAEDGITICLALSSPSTPPARRQRFERLLNHPMTFYAAALTALLVMYMIVAGCSNCDAGQLRSAGSCASLERLMLNRDQQFASKHQQAGSEVLVRRSSSNQDMWSKS